MIYASENYREQLGELEIRRVYIQFTYCNHCNTFFSKHVWIWKILVFLVNSQSFVAKQQIQILYCFIDFERQYPYSRWPLIFSGFHPWQICNWEFSKRLNVHLKNMALVIYLILSILHLNVLKTERKSLMWCHSVNDESMHKAFNAAYNG